MSQIVRQQKTVTVQSVRGRKSKKAKRVRRKPRTTNQQLQLVPQIKECTKEYACARINPFGARSTLPCIPDELVLPSHKFSARVRGVFSTGAAGVGWVSLNPWLMAINNGTITGALTNYPVIYTDATYLQNSYQWTAGGGAFTTVGVNGANSTSPYNGASFQDNDDYRTLRLVAAGVKCRYIGSSFRNQGHVILARQAGNMDYDSAAGISEAAFLQDLANVTAPLTRQTHFVVYNPSAQVHMTYNKYDLYNPIVSGVADLIGGRGLVIMATGGDTTTPQSFEFEAIAYFEATGRGLTLSPSHSDVEGMGIVNSSVPVRNSTSSPKQVETSVLGRVWNELVKQGTPYIVRGGLNLAAQGLNSYLSNRGNPMPMLAYGGMSGVTIDEMD